MHKDSLLYAGADVSADWIDVVCQIEDDSLEHRRFTNEPSGHQKLIAWLRGSPNSVRIVVEASGAYSTDLCLALHAAGRIEVMVLNPRAAKDYRRSQMHRSKTDRIDAAVLSGYARRRARISKEGNMRIRRALFMPAQVAIQWEPNVRAFYEKLTQERGKPNMVAIVAVMRGPTACHLRHAGARPGLPGREVLSDPRKNGCGPLTFKRALNPPLQVTDLVGALTFAKDGDSFALLVA